MFGDQAIRRQSSLSPRDGTAVGRMRDVGFTEEARERGREGEAPAEPGPRAGLGGSLAPPKSAAPTSRSDDHHPALRARPHKWGSPRSRGERGFQAALLVFFLLVGSTHAQEAPNSSRPSLARQRSDATAQTSGSQGWWLGTAAALVILAGAGALCLAARGKAAGAAAARLQVLGRVHLPPKHALYMVRAGRRTLLIGTGPQGAPSLLGELDDDPEPAAEPIGARLDAAALNRGARTPARFDVSLGDES